METKFDLLNAYFIIRLSHFNRSYQWLVCRSERSDLVIRGNHYENKNISRLILTVPLLILFLNYVKTFWNYAKTVQKSNSIDFVEFVIALICVCVL